MSEPALVELMGRRLRPSSPTGVADIDEIRFHPTLLTPDPKISFEAAIAAAKELAALS
jgi:hypothetical protein